MSLSLQQTVIIGGAGLALMLAVLALRPAAPPAPPASEAAGSAVDAPPTPPPAAAAPEPRPQPPAFDVVRIAADGGALVAGLAPPGTAVILRVDGVPVAETIADAAGQFVALFVLDPSEDPQTMTLEARRADGQVTAAPHTVILAPRPEAALALQDARGEAAERPADGSAAEPAPVEDPGAPPLPAAAEAEAMAAPTMDVAEAIAPPAEAQPTDPPSPEPRQADMQLADLQPAGRDPTSPEAVTQAAAQIDGTEVAIALPDAVIPPPDPQPLDLQSPTPQSPGPGLPPPGRLAAAPAPPSMPALASPEAGRSSHAAPRLMPPDSGPSVAASPAEPAPRAEDLPAGVAEATAGLAPPPTRADTPRPGRAPDEPSALLPPAFLLREGGALELASPALPPAGAVVIDAISYSETGEVQISGRAGRGDPQARVQLYLDNRPVALAQAERGAWSVAVPELAPGLYTLRADQLAADGRVATRFETPFLRAAPETLIRPPARPGRDGTAHADVLLMTVQPGHSLWRISRERYGEGIRYVQIYNANRDLIRDPDLIYPGQVFVLPE